MVLQVKGSAHIQEEPAANEDGDRPPAGPPESGITLSKGRRLPKMALHRIDDPALEFCPRGLLLC